MASVGGCQSSSFAGFRSRSYSYVDTHACCRIRFTDPCCSMFMHTIVRHDSAPMIARVNSSIHIVRNRSVLCTQMRLETSRTACMQNAGGQRSTKWYFMQTNNARRESR